ncbi:LexA/Signal peptidase [Phlebopus sp. FC_14]|nr:LexA/Signal peptidase [Phlebopus sp. FC_14]
MTRLPWLRRISQTLPLFKTVGRGCLHAINLACILHLFKENIGSPCFSYGPSMLPTLETEGEVLIESIITHRLAPLARGEIVSLKSPYDPNKFICKRVIGLPGDIVCVDPTGLAAPSMEHVVVPKGHVWIAGDNLALSTDSRDYGPVAMALIRGRIVARIFPFSRFKLFRPEATYIDD